MTRQLTALQVKGIGKQIIASKTLLIPELQTVSEHSIRQSQTICCSHIESVALYELAQAIEGDPKKPILARLNRSPDGLGKESAIKTQLGLIKQTTGKDVKLEAVIDFTLLRQVLAEAK